MIMISKILFPTDFSQNANAALAYACGLAEQNNADLHVLHVVNETVYVVPLDGMFSTFDFDVNSLRDAAQKGLDQTIDPAWKKAHRVVPEIRFGAPFREIIRHAKERSIDLIVMSTHGRTGLPHLLIGSVAENVVRKAPCPVLTVHPKDHVFVMP